MQFRICGTGIEELGCIYNPCILSILLFGSDHYLSSLFIALFIHLIYRQSHKSFFGKSDLFFVCMLQALSFDIQKQELEIEAAQVSLDTYFLFIDITEKFNYR